MLFKIIIFLFILYFNTNLFALISKRAKCAIQCYKKCSESGTPQAVYCNCPFTENDNCEYINEELLNEKTVENLIEFKSGYKNIRIIWLNVNPVPNAFIYIFEFSVQNTDIPAWIFAGASSSPQINFSIPDACRDYQFRLIIVLRSTDPRMNLIIFRGRQIPVEFPPFVIAEETILLDRPKQSNDGQTLHASISWQNPFGYEETDIYGYSPPTAYPISCQTPEERLSQPRLELIKGGARLHFALPIDALNEKYVLELNHLIYKYQQNLIVKNSPIYNIANEDSSSFINRKIIHSQHIKVPGNITKIELTPQWGIQYGLQICAFYFNENYENLKEINPFNIVPVIPFSCTPCAAPEIKSNEKHQERCIECTKIEQRQSPLLFKNINSPIPVDCIGPICASSNYSSTHFISSGIV
uniref:EGF-like domain-containing protein n=1 Tax=Meloidogyne hapla TaxID=6305 RepID=A0A1I8B9F4_MELHA